MSFSSEPVIYHSFVWCFRPLIAQIATQLKRSKFLVSMRKNEKKIYENSIELSHSSHSFLKYKLSSYHRSFVHCHIQSFGIEMLYSIIIIRNVIMTLFDRFQFPFSFVQTCWLLLIVPVWNVANWLFHFVSQSGRHRKYILYSYISTNNYYFPIDWFIRILLRSTKFLNWNYLYCVNTCTIYTRIQTI